MSYYDGQDALTGYHSPKRVHDAYVAVRVKWNWFEEQDSELWNYVKRHQADEVRSFELPEAECEHEEGDPECGHGWPEWFIAETRELLQELAETMEVEEDSHRLLVNLEDTEDRADISCRDYCAAYVAQYDGTPREAYESFCRSAVIDATDEEDEGLIGWLYNHLDPDGKDADITVAEAGKLLPQEGQP